MEKMIRNLLEKNDIEKPPLGLNQELYSWLKVASEKQSVTFISEIPMQQGDLQKLISQLGEVPDQLNYYYARSTPWPYSIEDYFEAVKRIETECISIFKKSGNSEEEARFRIREGKPLWPVHMPIKGSSAVAFLDSIGRLCLVEGSKYGGLGFGRPVSIGLRNYFVMDVITDLFWCESEEDISFSESTLNPMILSLGEWPVDNPPSHYLIDCFNLMQGRKGSPLDT